jgi:uncharacterized membrane protein YfhO
MLAQLDWPGYQATVDGQAVKVTENGIGLVMLTVPAGAHTVTLSFHDSGVRIGQYVLGIAALAALLLSFFYRRANASSATCLAISSELVAAGDGAFNRWI